jgi:LEA14-like dessication related protein
MLLALILSAACSMVRSLTGGAKVQKPRAELVSARLKGISFDRADLQFDVSLTNPNPLGVTLAGFGYRLTVNEQPFLQGREEESLHIQAQGESMLQIPVVLAYDHLYKTIQSLLQEDTATYRLECDFSFDLPAVGIVQVPMNADGQAPLPKLPALRIESLDLHQMSPLGADLVLNLRLENPNAFSMILEGMQYQLKINDQPWASGETGNRISISEKKDGLVEIPISLDFLTIGTSIHSLLREETSLNYQFQGDLDVSTSLPLLSRTHLPFDLSGKTEVAR